MKALTYWGGGSLIIIAISVTNPPLPIHIGLLLILLWAYISVLQGNLMRDCNEKTTKSL